MRSYDFSAPIAESGRPHGQYHSLRRLHTFVKTWPAWVAAQTVTFPAVRPSGPGDMTTLRWTVRSDGVGGLVTVVNYQRNTNMSNLTGVQLNVTLPSAVTEGGVVGAARTLTLPASGPVTVPAGAYFFWPFNLPVAGGAATLLWATAQPVTEVLGVPVGPWGAPATLVVMSASDAGGVIPVELALNASGVVVEACTGGAVCTVTPAGVLLVTGVPSGNAANVVLNVTAPPASAGGPATVTARLAFLILSWESSQLVWRGELGGVPSLFLTTRPEVALLLDPAVPTGVRLRGPVEDAPTPIVIYEELGVLPPPPAFGLPGRPMSPAMDGLFAVYTVPLPLPGAAVGWELVTPAGPARAVPTGPSGVASAPNQDGFDDEWAGAATYAVTLVPNLDANETKATRDLTLTVRYAADAARWYVPPPGSPPGTLPPSGGAAPPHALAADNFYNTVPWEVGVGRLAFEAPGTVGDTLPLNLTLRLLPLGKAAPIWLPAWPDFGNGTSVAELEGVQLVDYADVALTVSF